MAKIGASDLGFRIAEQFGINRIPPRPDWFPYHFIEREGIFKDLSGISFNAAVPAFNFV